MRDVPDGLEDGQQALYPHCGERRGSAGVKGGSREAGRWGGRGGEGWSGAVAAVMGTGSGAEEEGGADRRGWRNHALFRFAGHGDTKSIGRCGLSTPNSAFGRFALLPLRSNTFWREFGNALNQMTHV